VHIVVDVQLIDTVRNIKELPPKRPSKTISDLHFGFKDLEGDAVANERQGAGPS